MRLLHTADWHLGKTLARRNRDAEHAEALRRLLDVVENERPDALLVAGDIFDSAAPPPEAERQLYTFLTDMARVGVPTVMIAGNHDNPRRLSALRPLLQLAGVQLVDRPGPASDAVVELTSRDGRERLVVGCLPWLTERFVVPELDTDIRGALADLAAQAARTRKLRRGKKMAEAELFDPSRPAPLTYNERARGLMSLLARRFTADSVNVLLAHLFLGDARPGGGERDVDLDARYRLSTRDLPDHTHYVALGHIHRPQLIDAGRQNIPARYAGSLLQLGFGEARQQKSITLIEAEAGVGVTSTREIPIVAGRALTDVTGTRDELRRRAEAGEFGNDFLRVTLRAEVSRPGLADEIREFLPDAVQVRLDTPLPSPGQSPLVVGTPRAECDLLDLYESYHRDVVGRALTPQTADALRHLLSAEDRGDPVDAVAHPFDPAAGKDETAEAVESGSGGAPPRAADSLFGPLDDDDSGRFAGHGLHDAADSSH